jgi:soluble lytic murein transglycosylase-like protein
MSTGALTSTAAGGPPDALAAIQRVGQLKELIAQTQGNASTSSFAAALSAASAGASASAPAMATAASYSSPLTSPPPSSASPSTGAAPSSAVYTLPGTATTVGGAATSLDSTSPASTEPALASGPSSYDSLVNQSAARYGLDPAILHGLIQQESGFNPSSRSSAGALGLTQLMPSTAASLDVSNPLDPAQSIEGGARYLSQLMSQFGGNTTDALAAYNAGPGAVQRYGGVPPYSETQSYVTKVLGYASSYRQESSSSPGADGTTT